MLGEHLLVDGLGCNWGIQASHPIPPDIVVKLMKDNRFNKVKLFEADPRAMRALGRSGIQVMVGIPNDMLAGIASSVRVAEEWVAQNVSYYLSRQGVDIRYVAVGNEPFLKTYNDRFTQITFPALQNIQAALIKAGLGRDVKATVPLNADVYQSDSGIPSASPVVDGSITYTNVFDANYDTLISALEKNGFPSMPIIVGEVGWPTDGDRNANNQLARRFNQGLLDRINQGRGTPKRPTPPDIYLFSLIDEDAKSIDPGNFERHWGVFYFDGTIKYPLDLGGGRNLTAAKGVRYLARQWCIMAPDANLLDPNLPQSINFACTYADCTSLGPGSSCGDLDARGNASYAFNMYYQTMNQRSGACEQFHNLSIITRIDPGFHGGSCKYEIMIDNGRHEQARNPGTSSAGNMATSVVLWAVTLALIIVCGHLN
ncbi:UNVERIFIED_CONTAM: Glucan endo-1,3-beta-glucosidase 5 [Sesamum radiatum]|uniref:Glucan endo-1,3-beta-glucosidase 5 n=1 Tax=Sesamum radiatum TaxID=300843 RepID=A0AAW2R4Z5_SESRA